MTSPRTIHKTGDKPVKTEPKDGDSKLKDLSRLDEVDENEEQKQPMKGKKTMSAKRPAKVQNTKNGPPIVTGSSNISIGESHSNANRDRGDDSEDDMPTIKELKEENKKKEEDQSWKC